VIGVDASKSDRIDDTIVESFWRVLADRGVLLLRDQSLDHEQHLAFSRRLGPLADTGLITRYSVKGYPDIYMVTNTKVDGVRAETWNAARRWHSDQSFMTNPARASVFYCAECPAVGGDTMFANMYLAYETLSPGLKATLEPLRAFHSPFNSNNYQERLNRTPFTKEERRNAPGAWHPVVKTHPVNGKKCLFVSPDLVDRFEHWTIEESAPLLDYLFLHSVQPAFTYRHRWSPGDTVIWDNRCTMHLAPPDYDLEAMDAPENRRLMFRTTLA
jgi:taurine dioxygenase